MNILLTGGAGFIGTHTCVELVAAGHDVIVVDNYVNSQPEALRRVEELCGRKIPAYTADCRDKAAMTRIFDENKIDAVIHFAGLKAVGESVAKPLEYYRNNLDSTLTLCEVMRGPRLQAAGVQLLGHGIRRARRGTAAGGHVLQGLHQPLWLDQVHDRADSPGRVVTADPDLVRGAAALLQPHWRPRERPASARTPTASPTT